MWLFPAVVGSSSPRQSEGEASSERQSSSGTSDDAESTGDRQSTDQLLQSSAASAWSFWGQLTAAAAPQLEAETSSAASSEASGEDDANAQSPLHLSSIKPEKEAEADSQTAAPQPEQAAPSSSAWSLWGQLTGARNPAASEQPAGEDAERASLASTPKEKEGGEAAKSESNSTTPRDSGWGLIDTTAYWFGNRPVEAPTSDSPSRQSDSPVTEVLDEPPEGALEAATEKTDPPASGAGEPSGSKQLARGASTPPSASAEGPSSEGSPSGSDSEAVSNSDKEAAPEDFSKKARHGKTESQRLKPKDKAAGTQGPSDPEGKFSGVQQDDPAGQSATRRNEALQQAKEGVSKAESVPPFSTEKGAASATPAAETAGTAAADRQAQFAAAPESRPEWPPEVQDTQGSKVEAAAPLAKLLMKRKPGRSSSFVERSLPDGTSIVITNEEGDAPKVKAKPPRAVGHLAPPRSSPNSHRPQDRIGGAPEEQPHSVATAAFKHLSVSKAHPCKPKPPLSERHVPAASTDSDPHSPQIPERTATPQAIAEPAKRTSTPPPIPPNDQVSDLENVMRSNRVATDEDEDTMQETTAPTINRLPPEPLPPVKPKAPGVADGESGSETAVKDAQGKRDFDTAATGESDKAAAGLAPGKAAALGKAVPPMGKGLGAKPPPPVKPKAPGVADGESGSEGAGKDAQGKRDFDKAATGERRLQVLLMVRADQRGQERMARERVVLTRSHQESQLRQQLVWR
ncbi:hypothetical protein Efla_002937 [Eimeria flavescens]